MSRQTITRIHCARCFYGYVETTGILEEVDFELERRGWHKDESGHDVCSACVEAETVRGKRREAILLAQALSLLRVNGLIESPGNAQRIISAQAAALADIREEQAVPEQKEMELP